MSELETKFQVGILDGRRGREIGVAAMHPQGFAQITKAITPAEARELAALLTTYADQIESEDN